MIYVWADGEWCWYSQLEEAGKYKSDDYLEIRVPEWCDDEDAAWIASHVQKNGNIEPDILSAYFGLTPPKDSSHD